MNIKGIEVLTGEVWPIFLLQFEMLLLPVAHSFFLAVASVTKAKWAEGNFTPAPQFLPYNIQHKPFFSDSLREILTFPQSRWWVWHGFYSTTSVLGMVIQVHTRWMRDFHLSSWSWSGGAQQPEMKKKIKKIFYVTDRVWHAPEINLEAAKPAETTFLITSAAESWPETEPAVVSEELQSKSNASWTGVTVSKSMSERWGADLLKCSYKPVSYLCMHSYTAHTVLPLKCRLWIGMGYDELKIRQHHLQWLSSHLLPFKLPTLLFRP